MKIRLFYFGVLLGFFLFPGFIFGNEKKSDVQEIELSPEAIQDFFAPKDEKVSEIKSFEGTDSDADRKEAEILDPDIFSPPAIFNPEPVQEFSHYPWDIPASSDGRTSLPTAREVCERNLRRYGVSLDTKLSGCPELASQIIWENTDGSRIVYPAWSAEKKARLQEIFGRMERSERDLGLRCPELSNRNYQIGNLYFTQEEAFDVYAAHIAHSLRVEIDRLLPWSLLDNSRGENSVLLNSFYYHSRVLPFSGMGGAPYILSVYPAESSYQNFPSHSLPTISCDPRIAFDFLRGTLSSTRENLIGSSQEQTLVNLSWFLHKNAWHPNRDPLAVPVSEINTRYFHLRDRLRDHPFTARGRITHGLEQVTGCHSASHLMQDLSRSINLPVLPLWSAIGEIPRLPYNSSFPAHAALVFRWTQSNPLYLFHLDDLYVHLKPFFPMDNRLSAIREETARARILFENTWFSPSELFRWGYHFFEAYPLNIAGGFYRRDIYDLRPHLPHLGGFWERYMGAINVGFESHLLYREYNACPWTNYLEQYCATPYASGTRLYAQTLTTINSFGDMRVEIPQLSSPEEHDARAAQCVRAYGGCTHLRMLVEEFNMNHGLNHLE